MEREPPEVERPRKIVKDNPENELPRFGINLPIKQKSVEQRTYAHVPSRPMTFNPLDDPEGAEDGPLQTPIVLRQGYEPPEIEGEYWSGEDSESSSGSSFEGNWEMASGAFGLPGNNVQMQLTKAMTQLDDLADRQGELKEALSHYKHHNEQMGAKEKKKKKKKKKEKKEMEEKLRLLMAQQSLGVEEGIPKSRKHKKRNKKGKKHSSSSSSSGEYNSSGEEQKGEGDEMNNRLTELLEHQEKTMMKLVQEMSGDKVKQLEDQNSALAKRLQDLEQRQTYSNPYAPVPMAAPSYNPNIPGYAMGYGGEVLDPNRIGFNQHERAQAPFKVTSPPKGMFMGAFQERYLDKQN